jgi:hypothetical protein
MNGSEINACLGSIPGYLGCFSRDELPEKPPDNCSFVMNTDQSTGPGIHWQAVVLKRGVLHFFDSFGKPPKPVSYFKKFSRVLYSSAKCQHVTADTCGYYVIYVIFRMSQGESFRRIVSRFKKMRRDDRFLAGFMRREFGIRQEMQ